MSSTGSPDVTGKYRHYRIRITTQYAKSCRKTATPDVGMRASRSFLLLLLGDNIFKFSILSRGKRAHFAAPRESIPVNLLKKEVPVYPIKKPISMPPQKSSTETKD